MKGFETQTYTLPARKVSGKKECPAMKGFETGTQLATVLATTKVRRNAPL